ncbi:GEM-like protein 4 isoform X1 [Herrania umbratica]|uniref:GEM-like protein 4 isoform X1 n=1 Tax=Herrania umbratica TaxID=108875 RepID=A0A6J1AHC7_9ROSI|nr:GEM-like protein 4 isoform X1 [Herrania umbratica]
MDFKMGNTKNLRKESSNFASRLRDHVKMGSKLSETVKGKLRLGAKIIQEGGRENIFKQKFGMAEGEEMLKASQCYLSTTAGPIAGLLFVSTEKVAFISDSLITVSSATGQSIRIPYKVMIPIRKIKRANRSENVNKPAEKYLEVVTKDCFEFWFMGFLRYEQALDSLQKALWLVDIQLTPKCRRRLFLKSA